MTMKYNEAQFLLSMARAAQWTAIVQTGAYKLSKTQVGCGHNDDGTIKFRPLTDDEKLEQALGTVRRHLEIAATFAETLPVEAPNEINDDQEIKRYDEGARNTLAPWCRSR
jgi:hypothetical protein